MWSEAVTTCFRRRPVRRLEWWLAFSTVAWGFFLVAVPTALETPPYAVMRLWMPASVWGEAAAVVGMVHIWALVINGCRHWSPHVRVIATVLTSVVFTAASAGTAASVWLGIAPLTLAAPVHLMLTGAALCAAWVAGTDSISAYASRSGGRPHGV